MNFYVGKLAADLQAAYITETTFRSYQVTILRFDKEVDQDVVIFLKLVFFYISNFYISIIDTGTRLDGTQFFRSELDVQARGVLRFRRACRETIEFTFGNCRRSDLDTDVTAGENCI